MNDKPMHMTPEQAKRAREILIGDAMPLTYEEATDPMMMSIRLTEFLTLQSGFKIAKEELERLHAERNQVGNLARIGELEQLAATLQSLNEVSDVEEVVAERIGQLKSQTVWGPPVGPGENKPVPGIDDIEF